MFLLKILRNKFLISLVLGVFIVFIFLDYHISKILVPVIFILAMFNKPKEIFQKLFENSFYFSIFLMTVYVYISLVWSKNICLDLGFSTMWGTLLLIPLFNELIDHIHKKNLFYLFIPAVFYISFWILLINTDIIKINFEISNDQVIPGWNYIRISFFLGVTTILLAAYLYKNYKIISRIQLFLYIFVIFLCIIDIFFIKSRMGIFAFLITSSLFFTYIMRNNIIIGLILLSIIIFLILGMAYKFSPHFKDRINYTFESFNKFKVKKDYSTSGGQRIGIWTIAKDIILEHPVKGSGGGSYRKSFEKLYHEKYSFMDELVLNAGKATLHNEYIQTLTQYGIIGLLLYLNIFYQMMKIAFRNNNGLTALLFIIYYFIFALTDIFFERYRTLYLLIIFLPVIAFNILNKNHER